RRSVTPRLTRPRLARQSCAFNPRSLPFPCSPSSGEPILIVTTGIQGENDSLHSWLSLSFIFAVLCAATWSTTRRTRHTRLHVRHGSRAHNFPERNHGPRAFGNLGGAELRGAPNDHARARRMDADVPRRGLPQRSAAKRPAWRRQDLLH